MVDAAQLWSDFIARLNVVRPLGKRDEIIEHKAFIGSIEAYRKIFMDAARERQERTENDQAS